MIQLPNSVLYVKNGAARWKWWETAKQKNQIHAGWKKIPSKILCNYDAKTIDKQYYRYYPQGTGQDLNALKRLLDHPSQHVWITAEHGFLWWCLVKNRAKAKDNDQDGRGHLWLECSRPWSNKSLQGHSLALSDLPGAVAKVAGFKGTVCKPEAWQQVLQIIQGLADKTAMAANRTRLAYKQAVQELIRDLGHKDFEQLIELIVSRSGWERISKETGGVQEGIDLDVEIPALNERAFVQIKSAATQKTLDQYVQRFNRQHGTYSQMIFAVHSPKGQLRAAQKNVRIWTDSEIAGLVVRLGLGERVEMMRGKLGA